MRVCVCECVCVGNVISNILEVLGKNVNTAHLYITMLGEKTNILYWGSNTGTIIRGQLFIPNICFIFHEK